MRRREYEDLSEDELRRAVHTAQVNLDAGWRGKPPTDIVRKLASLRREVDRRGIEL